MGGCGGGSIGGGVRGGGGGGGGGLLVHILKSQVTPRDTPRQVRRDTSYSKTQLLRFSPSPLPLSLPLRPYLNFKGDLRGIIALSHS